MSERAVTERLVAVEGAKLASWNAYQTVQAARKQALEELRDTKPVLTLAGLLERLERLEQLLWEVLDRG